METEKSSNRIVDDAEFPRPVPIQVFEEGINRSSLFTPFRPFSDLDFGARLKNSKLYTL